MELLLLLGETAGTFPMKLLRISFAKQFPVECTHTEATGPYQQRTPLNI